jgi:hypothetical protein
LEAKFDFRFEIYAPKLPRKSFYKYLKNCFRG